MQTSLEHSPISRTPPCHTYIIRLIELILTCNNFSFNGDHYLQTQSTAMRTRMAPFYANLFMANLEKDLMATNITKPKVWWQYIDDIFAI